MAVGSAALTSRNLVSSAFAGRGVLALLSSVLGFCLLISLGAQVRVPVPFTEVPMTFQLLAVLLTGFALTPSRAVAATLLYLACGTAGLPVFVQGSTGLVGTTGGYLAGFVVGAWLISVLKGSQASGFVRSLMAAVIGTSVVFAFGITWRVALASLFGFFDGDARFAVVSGLLPFLAKSTVEVLLAATLVAATGGRSRRPAHRVAGRGEKE